MKEFAFPLDDEGRAFCHEIAREMTRLFNIKEDEAIGRINRHWKRTELIGKENIIYHEDSIFWAKDIYYGCDSKWWKSEEGLKPMPYPGSDQEHG